MRSTFPGRQSPLRPTSSTIPREKVFLEAETNCANLHNVRLLSFVAFKGITYSALTSKAGAIHLISIFCTSLATCDERDKKTEGCGISMQSKCQHFVITRLGLGIYDESRLNKLIDLFEAVTLPSLLNQSSQEFVWLVSIDSAFSEKAKSKIAKLLDGHSNCYVVPIDVTGLINVRLACFDWVWDHYQDFILENDLLKNPHDYIVTSIVDADDAWHRDVISTVNNLIANRLPYLCERSENRGTWLRHSSGLAITFPNGYAWFISEKKYGHCNKNFAVWRCLLPPVFQAVYLLAHVGTPNGGSTPKFSNSMLRHGPTSSPCGYIQGMTKRWGNGTQTPLCLCLPFLRNVLELLLVSMLLK